MYCHAQGDLSTPVYKVYKPRRGPWPFLYHGHVHIAIVQSSSLLFGLHPIPHLPQCLHEALIDDSEEADSSDEIEQSDNKEAEELCRHPGTWVDKWW